MSDDFQVFYGDIERTAIKRYIVQLHVDLDVLDQSVMPAVDSPGSPGLTFAQLRSLLARLYRSGRVTGATSRSTIRFAIRKIVMQH